MRTIPLAWGRIASKTAAGEGDLTFGRSQRARRRITDCAADQYGRSCRCNSRRDLRGKETQAKLPAVLKVVHWPGQPGYTPPPPVAPLTAAQQARFAAG